MLASNVFAGLQVEDLSSIETPTTLSGAANLLHQTYQSPRKLFTWLLQSSSGFGFIQYIHQGLHIKISGVFWMTSACTIRLQPFGEVT